MKNKREKEIDRIKDKFIEEYINFVSRKCSEMIHNGEIPRITPVKEFLSQELNYSEKEANEILNYFGDDIVEINETEL